MGDVIISVYSKLDFKARWYLFCQVLLSYSKEQSSSWEALCPKASQETFCNLWNMKFRYHVCKSPLLVPILCQMNPFHNLQSCLFKTHLIYVTLQSGVFPSGFTPKPCTNFLYPRTCCLYISSYPHWYDLLLPLALQPTVGFGLSNNVLQFFPICHQLFPSSHSHHLKISFYFRFPSFSGSSPSSHPFHFLSEDLFGHPILHSL